MAIDPPPPPSGLRELLGSTLRYISNVSNAVSRTGFDLAHMIGDAFWRNNLQDFMSLSRDSASNLRYLPKTQRGAATLNVSMHSANIADIDKLPMDLVPGPNGTLIPDPNSRNFLNVNYYARENALIGARAGNATPTEIADIEQHYRIREMNAFDYWKTLDLGQEHLDAMGRGLKQVFLTGVDPVADGDREAVRAYRNQPQVARQFNYDFMMADPYFQEIEGIRGSAEIDIESELIRRYPVQGFVRFPGGEVIWSDDMRAYAFARVSIRLSSTGSRIQPNLPASLPRSSRACRE
jgi:hypothetical protein